MIMCDESVHTTVFISSLLIYLFILPFTMFFSLSHAKLGSAQASTSQIAVVLQSNNCEWGTCSRPLWSIAVLLKLSCVADR